ncbi:MAG: hypothetical protein JJE52_17010 [Acidimicrobiia bacterium]|nr:hypothetical protein [Acidimicrobiia bacterium]
MPIDECERRDRKGLYATARRGLSDSGRGEERGAFATAPETQMRSRSGSSSQVMTSADAIARSPDATLPDP